jgi:transposase InsO family protein
MARSTFYYHIKRIKREDKYSQIRIKINKIYHQHKGRYGYRRITFELNNEGCVINHKTVKKLMDELGIKCQTCRVKYHSYKGEKGKTASNLISRNFYAESPYKKLTTDVSQVSIRGEKCYLSPIMDMFNGEIISYTISKTPNLEMVIKMLQEALQKMPPLKEAILHSDQGWHYQHNMYRHILKQNGIIQSMSRKGNCIDNAMMESFFGSMKSELLYPNNYNNIEEFTKDLVEYINYYNLERIKLRLDGMSPIKYRIKFQLQQ